MRVLCGVAGFFLMLVSSVSLADERPEVSKYVEAYSSNTSGAEVYLTRIGPHQANQAIVQVVGIDHDWDGKIQKMDISEVSNTSDERRFSLKVKDKTYNMVLVLKRNGEGLLYLPGNREPYRISYDKALSGQANAQYFLTDYLKQQEQR